MASVEAGKPNGPPNPVEEPTTKSGLAVAAIALLSSTGKQKGKVRPGWILYGQQKSEMKLIDRSPAFPQRE